MPQTTRAPSLGRFVTTRDRRPCSTSGEDAATTVAPKLRDIERSARSILMEPELSDIWRAGSWRWLGGWADKTRLTVAVLPPDAPSRRPGFSANSSHPCPGTHLAQGCQGRVIGFRQGVEVLLGGDDAGVP